MISAVVLVCDYLLVNLIIQEVGIRSEDVVWGPDLYPSHDSHTYSQDLESVLLLSVIVQCVKKPPPFYGSKATCGQIDVF